MELAIMNFTYPKTMAGWYDTNTAKSTEKHWNIADATVLPVSLQKRHGEMKQHFLVQHKEISLKLDCIHKKNAVLGCLHSYV
jgi:hypothetical protein